MNQITKNENYFELLLSKDNEEVKRQFEISYVQNFFTKHLNQGIPKDDIINFFHKAQKTGADPQLEQIYLIKREIWQPDNKPKIVVGTIVFSYHFIEEMAQKSGEYEGFKSNTDIGKYYDPSKNEIIEMLFSECTVTRKGKSFTYKAWFKEFSQTKVDYKTKEVSLIGNWAAKPYLMLEKCARANALKAAFPEWIKGMSAIDELGSIEKEDHFIEAQFEEKTKELEETRKRIELEKKLQSENDAEKINAHILEINNALDKITKGFNINQKASAIKTFLGVSKNEELNNFSFNVLQEKLKTLQNALLDEGRVNTYRSLMLEPKSKPESNVEEKKDKPKTAGNVSFRLD